MHKVECLSFGRVNLPTIHNGWLAIVDARSKAWFHLETYIRIQGVIKVISSKRKWANMGRKKFRRLVEDGKSVCRNAGRLAQYSAVECALPCPAYNRPPYPPEPSQRPQQITSCLKLQRGFNTRRREQQRLKGSTAHSRVHVLSISVLLSLCRF